MRRSTDRQAASAEILALLIAILFSSPLMLSAADLNQQTLNAWDEYILGINSQMKDRATGGSSFLWIDEAPGRRDRVRQGEILVEPASKDTPEKVPQGLIHNWLGAIFIPNATLISVFAMLNDYGHYDQIYNPAVIDAKLLNVSGAMRKFSLVLAEKAPFVTAAIASEYVSQNVRLDKHRWYTVTYSTRIQQIDNFGRPGAHELPPDQGTGYIWRLFSIQRFEEKDGGVYTELETIALSRNIPFEIQWLVRPILQHLPRESMTATLQKTRDAVCAALNAKAAEPVAPSPSTGGSRRHDASVTARRSLTTRPIPATSVLGAHQ
jgi:hypothetical protein